MLGGRVQLTHALALGLAVLATEARADSQGEPTPIVVQAERDFWRPLEHWRHDPWMRDENRLADAAAAGGPRLLQLHQEFESWLTRHDAAREWIQEHAKEASAKGLEDASDMARGVLRMLVAGLVRPDQRVELGRFVSRLDADQRELLRTVGGLVIARVQQRAQTAGDNDHGRTGGEVGRGQMDASRRLGMLGKELDRKLETRADVLEDVRNPALSETALEVVEEWREEIRKVEEAWQRAWREERFGEFEIESAEEAENLAILLGWIELLLDEEVQIDEQPARYAHPERIIGTWALRMAQELRDRLEGEPSDHTARRLWEDFRNALANNRRLEQFDSWDERIINSVRDRWREMDEADADAFLFERFKWWVRGEHQTRAARNASAFFDGLDVVAVTVDVLHDVLHKVGGASSIAAKKPMLKAKPRLRRDENDNGVVAWEEPDAVVFLAEEADHWYGRYREAMEGMEGETLNRLNAIGEAVQIVRRVLPDAPGQRLTVTDEKLEQLLIDAQLAPEALAPLLEGHEYEGWHIGRVAIQGQRLQRRLIVWVDLGLRQRIFSEDVAVLADVTFRLELDPREGGQPPTLRFDEQQTRVRWAFRGRTPQPRDTLDLDTSWVEQRWPGLAAWLRVSGQRLRLRLARDAMFTSAQAAQVPLALDLRDAYGDWHEVAAGDIEESVQRRLIEFVHDHRDALVDAAPSLVPDTDWLTQAVGATLRRPINDLREMADVEQGLRWEVEIAESSLTVRSELDPGEALAVLVRRLGLADAFDAPVGQAQLEIRSMLTRDGLQHRGRLIVELDDRLVVALDDPVAAAEALLPLVEVAIRKQLKDLRDGAISHLALRLSDGPLPLEGMRIVYEETTDEFRQVRALTERLARQQERWEGEIQRQVAIGQEAAAEETQRVMRELFAAESGLDRPIPVRVDVDGDRRQVHFDFGECGVIDLAFTIDRGGVELVGADLPDNAQRVLACWALRQLQEHVPPSLRKALAAAQDEERIDVVFEDGYVTVSVRLALIDVLGEALMGIATRGGHDGPELTIHASLPLVSLQSFEPADVRWTLDDVQWSQQIGLAELTLPNGAARGTMRSVKVPYAVDVKLGEHQRARWDGTVELTDDGLVFEPGRGEVEQIVREAFVRWIREELTQQVQNLARVLGVEEQLLDAIAELGERIDVETATGFGLPRAVRVRGRLASRIDLAMFPGLDGLALENVIVSAVLETDEQTGERAVTFAIPEMPINIVITEGATLFGLLDVTSGRISVGEDALDFSGLTLERGQLKLSNVELAVPIRGEGAWAGGGSLEISDASLGGARLRIDPDRGAFGGGLRMGLDALSAFVDFDFNREQQLLRARGGGEVLGVGLGDTWIHVQTDNNIYGGGAKLAMPIGVFEGAALEMRGRQLSELGIGLNLIVSLWIEAAARRTDVTLHAIVPITVRLPGIRDLHPSLIRDLLRNLLDIRALLAAIQVPSFPLQFSPFGSPGNGGADNQGEEEEDHLEPDGEPDERDHGWRVRLKAEGNDWETYLVHEEHAPEDGVFWATVIAHCRQAEDDPEQTVHERQPPPIVPSDARGGVQLRDRRDTALESVQAVMLSGCHPDEPDDCTQWLVPPAESEGGAVTAVEVRDGAAVGCGEVNGGWVPPAPAWEGEWIRRPGSGDGDTFTALRWLRERDGWDLRVTAVDGSDEQDLQRWHVDPLRLASAGQVATHVTGFRQPRVLTKDGQGRWHALIEIISKREDPSRAVTTRPRLLYVSPDAPERADALLPWGSAFQRPRLHIGFATQDDGTGEVVVLTHDPDSDDVFVRKVYPILKGEEDPRLDDLVAIESVSITDGRWVGIRVLDRNGQAHEIEPASQGRARWVPQFEW